MSFSCVELETKRILLDIFKEKQQKSAEAGTIPSFYKKACSRIFVVFQWFCSCLGIWVWRHYFYVIENSKKKKLFHFGFTLVMCSFLGPLWLSKLFPFFQKPEDGSISHRVQRLAKYRFLKVIIWIFVLIVVLLHWLSI